MYVWLSVHTLFDKYKRKPDPLQLFNLIKTYWQKAGLRAIL